jgi:hypothetical protein
MEWSIIAMRENSLHGMVYYRQEGEFTPWNGLLSSRGRIHSMEWSIIAKREKFTPWNGLLSLRGRNSLHGMVYYH